MTDHRRRLVDTATRVFPAETEQKLAAQSVLEQCLSDDDEALAGAADRLEKVSSKSVWTGRIMAALIVLAGLTLVAVPAYKIYQASAVLEMNNILGIPLPTKDNDPWEFYFEDLSDEDRLLLFGDTSAADEAGKKEAFWRHEPENPGAYVEYLTAYQYEHDRYPEDMLEVAAEIDPDNAVYLLFQAASMVDDCTETVYPSHSSSGRSRGRRSRRGAKPSPPVSPAPAVVTRRHVAITDEAKHREVMKLLQQAVEKKKCTSHGGEMMRRRLPLLERDDNDWLTRMLPALYLASNFSIGMDVMKVSRTIQAEAYRCEQEKDEQALRQLVVLWKAYCNRLDEFSESLLDGLLLRAAIHAPCKDFAVAAKACGLAEMEKYFSDLDQQLSDERDDRRHASDAPGEAELYKYGSVLSSISVPIMYKQVNDPGVIPAPDPRADRLADHAFWNRVTSAALWLVLLLCASVAWLWQLRSNRMLRKLGHRLGGVLIWRDWLWIVMVGILAPIAAYWLVNGSQTAVSAQQYNLSFGAMLMASGQSASLLLLLVLCPMLMVTQRLNKALPVLPKNSLRLLMAAIFFVLLAMPAFALAGQWDNHYEEIIKAAYATLGMSVLLLLACPLLALIRHHGAGGTALIKAARVRVLAGTYLVASLAVALQIPVYHEWEKHWVAQDEMFEYGEEHTSLTQVETQVTRQLLKELNELLAEIKTDFP